VLLAADVVEADLFLEDHAPAVCAALPRRCSTVMICLMRIGRVVISVIRSAHAARSVPLTRL
jgi:hypothetical protein